MFWEENFAPKTSGKTGVIKIICCECVQSQCVDDAFEGLLPAAHLRAMPVYFWHQEVLSRYITNKTNKTVNMFFKTHVADRNTKTRVSYYYYYFNCGQLEDSNYSSVQLIIQKILACVRVKRGQVDFNLAEHKHTSGWRPSNKTFKTLITLQVQRGELSWHVIRYIKTKLFSWQLVA